jgi:hypothetical protein
MFALPKADRILLPVLPVSTVVFYQISLQPENPLCGQESECRAAA